MNADTSREIRLWIKDIIVPAVVLIGGVYFGVPGVKSYVDNAIKDAMDNIKKKAPFNVVADTDATVKPEADA